MKRNFNSFLTQVLFFVSPILVTAQQSTYYELNCWHFKDQEQEKKIDNYLKNSLLPALHRNGISKVGVFKNIGNDTSTDKTIWMLVPLKEFNHLVRIYEKLQKDNQYLKAGDEYLNSSYKKPAYTRMENIILKAFPLAPSLSLPNLKGPKNERIYELRSYESATENLHINKVKMFNEGGEIDIFKRLNFNAVFYGSVMAGCHKPNLMYMTSYENMQDRDVHWKAFSSDAVWKKISAEPAYQNNVSHIDDIFLHAAEYSDF